MSKFKHLTVSLEGIEFQNGAFFKELVLTLKSNAPERRKSMNKTDFKKLSGLIDAVVLRHTGLNVDTAFEDFDLNGYVAVPLIDLNNPLYRDYNELFEVGTTGVDWFVKENKNQFFRLNRSTGMVSGKLTEQKFKLGLAGMTYVNGKLSDEEMAAVILHEIGHLYSFFEMFATTVTTNIVLQELDQRLRTNPTPKEREVILDRAGKALGMERTVVVDAQKSSSDEVVMTLYIGHAIENIRSETGHSYFDTSTWETQADQYAVRQGAGKYLATALDKMYAGDSATSVGSRAKYLVFEVLKMIQLGLHVGLSGTGLVLSLTTGAAGMAFLCALFLAAALLYFTGDNSNESTPIYATAFTRMQRIRQQLVLRAKEITSEIQPLEVRQQLLADIAALDLVMKGFADRQSWFDTMAAFLFTSVRNKQTNARFQKQLEALALNSLYVQALSLQTPEAA